LGWWCALFGDSLFTAWQTVCSSKATMEKKKKDKLLDISRKFASEIEEALEDSPAG
jgi:hypothetical protein